MVQASMENKKYNLYVNGILAKRFLTAGGAVKEAMKFFPSYVTNTTTNKVVWTGAK